MAEIRAEAAHSAAASPLKNNTHIHLPPNFSAFENVAQAVELVLNLAQDGDLILTLGAGNVWQAGDLILERLRENRRNGPQAKP